MTAPTTPRVFSVDNDPAVEESGAGAARQGRRAWRSGIRLGPRLSLRRPATIDIMISIEIDLI
jgi:hypothetical protein